MIPDVEKKDHVQLCALEYRPRGEETSSDDGGKILAIISATELHRVRVRVHPEWQRIVELRDYGYLEALFQDLKERAKRDPVNMCKQLSALTVGPLICREPDSAHGEDAWISELFNQFRDL